MCVKGRNYACAPILMQKQHVKPVVLITRHKHPNAIASELEVHACVLHVSDAIQPKTGVALPEKDGADGDSTRVTACRCRWIIDWEVELTHIVNKASRREDIKRREGTFLSHR
jgi:hypothetical protein